MSIHLELTTTVTAARWASQILGVVAITQLAQAIVAPNAIAKMFGLPLSSEPRPSRREKQWITIYASRNAILGVLMLTFGYGQNDWKAVGTIFKVRVLGSVVDMMVAGLQEGQMGKFAFHGAGTAAIAMIAYLLG